MRPLTKSLQQSIFYTAIVMACIWMPYSSQAGCVFSSPFTAQELEMGNLLTWSTSLEIENETFVIQRSVDGIEFETEGVIRGAKNSEEERFYRFLDVSVGDSKVFYRLIDMDSKGNYAISHTIIVDRQKENNLLVTSISNTETDRFFSMTMESSLEEMVTYQLIDTNNKVVIDGELAVVKGLNALSIDLKDLENGQYKLQLLAKGESEELYLQKEAKAKNKSNLALKNKEEK